MEALGHFNPEMVSHMDPDRGVPFILGGKQLNKCSGFLLVAHAGFQAAALGIKLIDADFTLGAKGLDGLPTRSLRLHDPGPMHPGIFLCHGESSSASDMVALQPHGSETEDTPDLLTLKRWGALTLNFLRPSSAFPKGSRASYHNLSPCPMPYGSANRRRATREYTNLSPSGNRVF